jgi:TonB family protein
MPKRNFWYAPICPLNEYRAEARPGKDRKIVFKQVCSLQGVKKTIYQGHWVVVLLLLAGIWAITCKPLAWGQEEITRKVKTRVAPAYPELARRMNITGVVRVLVTVTPTGTVKDAKLVGGHPVLAGAALDAVKKWHFEAGPQESSGIVEFHFDPTQ